MAVIVERFEFDPIPHGAGAFGKIIKGHDRFLERNIALKILDPLFEQSDEEDRERFRREARILAKLSHPNIPAIYDVEFGDEHNVIIFEFIEGMDLAQFIHDEGPCSLTQAREWFHQVASALQHAHDETIVHRDVKPSNIILSPELETAYLVDFGIALSAEDARIITESGVIIGTAGYMAPEHARGDEVDHLADIYSLGVTLYEALAGTPIGVGAYNPLSATNEAIPREIDSLIQDCIHHNKDQRVRSAEEFAQRLTGALMLRRPLSEILARGRLHEIALALEALTAERLATLPEGQKALIVSKVMSVINSDDPTLSFPGAELLELMLIRGLMLPKEEYRKIVSPSIRWAFEKTYPGFEGPGKRSLQDRFREVCLIARHDAHSVLREEIEKFQEEIVLEEKESWYLHKLRDILSCLLANPDFVSDATQMANFLDEVNQVQRSRE